MEDIEIMFPGGKRVDARVGSLVVSTDQPVEGGGQGTAAGPYDLFLASLATCTGFYVLGFCQARGLSTEGIALRQHIEVDPETRLPRDIRLELTLPPSFPERYRVPILRAAQGCKVKKTIAAAPHIDVVLTAPEVQSAPERATMTR